ncbi:hypothetical protein SLS56_003519 [Neofusicoccum ribis]|uniref:GST N-terminal domain-containing protein n=1 Tax=Neofusicoccum ribis TaxID=45134 RepID=A0ABR3SZ58_9PEZI
MADQQLPIILFCYPGSVYSRRVSWYLDLRRIPYTQSIQPPQLPRPLLKRTLHLNYRRIPVLAIGRSLLCDTRLILAKLERLFPPSAAHPSLLPSTDGGGAATLAALLEQWTTGPDVFFAAVGLIPATTPLLRDPAFVADRAELAGVDLAAAAASGAARPAARAHVERALGFVDAVVLAAGARDWVAGAEPSLADLQGVWVLDWLLCDPFMEGALGSPEEVGELEGRFPHAVGWVRRWRRWVVEEKGAWDAEREEPRAPVGEEEVVAKVFGEGSTFVDEVAAWDEAYARVLGLERGAVVEVAPTDYGSKHKDRGRLVGFGLDEVVIEVDVEERGCALRLHFPRTGFQVQKVE